MTLTPGDLSRVELPRAFRGYDIQATRELLEDAADEFKAAVSKRDRLLEEVRLLEQKLAGSPQHEGDVDERVIGEALVAATRAAEELREKGRRESDDAIAEAKLRAREILVTVERECEATRAEVEKQIQALLEDAKAEAQRARAEGEQQRKKLQAEAERLRALTDQTAANLRSLLVGALEQLEGHAETQAEIPAAVKKARVPADDTASATLLEQLRPATTERRGKSRR